MNLYLICRYVERLNCSNPKWSKFLITHAKNDKISTNAVHYTRTKHIFAFALSRIVNYQTILVSWKSQKNLRGLIIPVRRVMARGWPSPEVKMRDASSKILSCVSFMCVVHVCTYLLNYANIFKVTVERPFAGCFSLHHICFMDIWFANLNWPELYKSI